MKKVINKQNEQVILLEDITDDMIVGVLWESGVKSFLIKDYDGNTVSLELNERTTVCNWSKPSHREYVKNSGFDAKSIFVFDSPKELAQWLAE